MRHSLCVIFFCFLLWGCSAQKEILRPEIQVETLVASSISWDGGELPPYPSEKPFVSILKIKVAPGAILPLHKHPIINAGYMLVGELTITTDEGKTLHLKEGEPIIEVVDKWHSGRNTGGKIAEIIVFYAGTKGMSLSIKKEVK
jgi:quercetin dioxygenase-like cupin family protein